MERNASRSACVWKRMHLRSWSQISTSLHLEMHASWKLIPNLNFLGFVSLHSAPLCISEVDPKSQLPYVWKCMRLGSWSQISTSLHLFHYTPLHSPLHSICNSYIGTLPLPTLWERWQSTFATTLLWYMCVMFRLSAQVSTKRINLCTNLTVRLK